jgi:sugar-specific transcriptional regulator TrmB
MYKNVLEKSGLKSGEAEIYDLLLQYGDSPASQLTPKTKFKRGMVYKFLEDLEKIGLISKYERDRKTYFSPNHPSNLLNLLEKNVQEVRTQKTALEASLDEISASYRMVASKPTVTYYEGLSGIEKVFEDIYAPKEEPVYGCVDLEKSNKAMPNHITGKLIPLRIRNKVEAVTFLGDSKLAEEVKSKDRESLRKSVLLDKEKYPLPAEIDVYEDKIALLSFDKEKFVGILIENQDMATSLKSIFRLAYDKSKKK